MKKLTHEYQTHHHSIRGNGLRRHLILYDKRKSRASLLTLTYSAVIHQRHMSYEDASSAVAHMSLLTQWSTHTVQCKYDFE